jgi:hypothetical protein
MSRNFHNLHVHAPTEAARARVVEAVLAYAAKAGYQRVARAGGADRVIRVGGTGPWLTVADDASETEALVAAVSRATRLPVLEAYCEASAIVWLALHAGGKPAGGWAREGLDAPPPKRVAPLLVKGTPVELAEAFAAGLAQTFPETALAVAAERFGLTAARLFGETALRGTTIALRRRKAAWTPRFLDGEPAFRVGFGSNQGWGARHLVFEGARCEHRVQITSTGGPGRGLSIRFGGSAVEQGFVEIVSCAQAALALAPAGPSTFRDPGAKIPAGLVEPPDTFSMGRREADKASAIADARVWYVDLAYRALKEGECELVAEVASGAGEARGSLSLMIMWKPWRPSVAGAHVDDHALFAMHRRDHVSATIALRGPLAEAWAFARPHIEAWSAAHEDRILRVERDGEVVLLEHPEEGAPPFDRVAALIPGPTTPFQIQGASYVFGTTRHAPWRMDLRDQLAVQLVLSARDPACEHTADLARLEALCDEAIRAGLASSALVELHQHRAGERTRWEEVAVGGDDTALRLAAWQDTHARGIDKRIWLSPSLAARLDRAALPEHVAVTDLGGGLRLQVRDDRPRRDLEPLIAALGPLVPTTAEVARWSAERG